MPTARQIFVVYNPTTHRWLIDLARESALKFGLVVHVIEASDLRESVQHFSAIFDHANPETDALWLVGDAALVDTQTLLPLIIERSWNRRLAVFSNNLQQAERGLLFALYPDLRQLGDRLIQLAELHGRNPTMDRHIEPLRAVKRVLNLKISAHLNLKITQDTERKFDTVLPPW